MPKKKPPSPAQLAASIYGCDVADLLAHHEFDDGSIAIIAPTGQKFVYSAERILEEQDKDIVAELTDSQVASSQNTDTDSRVPATASKQGGDHGGQKPQPGIKNRNR